MASRWDELKSKKASGDVKPWDFLDPRAEWADEATANSRYALCLSCPELIKTTKQCKKCGCFMNAKTKLKNANCPIGKW